MATLALVGEHGCALHGLAWFGVQEGLVHSTQSGQTRLESARIRFREQLAGASAPVQGRPLAEMGVAPSPDAVAHRAALGRRLGGMPASFLC